MFKTVEIRSHIVPAITYVSDCSKHFTFIMTV